MKFITEQQSIDYLVNKLYEKGWESINTTQSKDPYCYYDIEGVFKGNIIRIECKRRNYKSTQFNDAILEKSKYDKFIDDLKANKFNRCYLVSFFEDCMTISDVTHPFDVDFRYANKTTDFDNKEIVEKCFVHYKQEKKINY